MSPNQVVERGPHRKLAKRIPNWMHGRAAVLRIVGLPLVRGQDLNNGTLWMWLQLWNGARPIIVTCYVS